MACYNLQLSATRAFCFGVIAYIAQGFPKLLANLSLYAFAKAANNSEPIRDGETVGLVFLTAGFSGVINCFVDPLKAKVVLSPDTVINNAYIIEHSKPIVLIGISDVSAWGHYRQTCLDGVGKA